MKYIIVSPLKYLFGAITAMTGPTILPTTDKAHQCARQAQLQGKVLAALNPEQLNNYSYGHWLVITGYKWDYIYIL